MFIVSALPPLILGFSVLLAVRIAFTTQRRVDSSAIVLSLTIAGWTMVFFAAALLGLFTVVIVFLIFAMTVAKFREGERRALLWTLSVAAEKGLPLSASARAFAVRRNDEMARRAWVLADCLDSGMPLQKALTRSGNPLPLDATMMVGLGADPRTAALALRESAEQSYGDDAWRPVFEQTLYLLCVALFCVFITTFIMIKIIPTFEAIFQDFGMQLPATSQLMIELGNSAASFWWVSIPFMFFIVVSMLIAAWHYARGRIWVPWPFSRLFGQSDNPTVLRGLAVCVEREQPIDQALSRLGHVYPRKDVAKRLLSAAGATTVGKDWCDSLLEQRIITKSESAVLKSATRTGNLSWALREMAEAGSRRRVYRARTILSIATPVCLILIAIPIALLSFGCFMPLITLIQGMSGG